ncbi:DUF2132 domain-containing protein [Psychromonas sp. RZ22]|uniref:VF530 family DNA-binding protein n=1 Tax=Psychromonas algarum TaxID=2555643 RepID=UPI001067F385|nr:VF530 family DNA-binding protein [Psychromonas sp. RZ22]TEW55934.1 DUF2132 domain-containing protein [Psychromonas sp. RZ22]
MTAKTQNNPLYGLKLEILLTEISEHYTWPGLSKALRIDRFDFHTGMKSTCKFLRNNQWAREKVETFYLHEFKAYPYPEPKLLAKPPRDRHIPEDQVEGTPEIISDELIERVDIACKYRVYDKVNAIKKEPVYDPSNPWGIK